MDGWTDACGSVVGSTTGGLPCLGSFFDNGQSILLYGQLVKNPGHHEAALSTLQSFTSSMKLRVGWNKRYAWAMELASKKWLKRNLQLLLPQGVVLDLQDHIRELGVQLQFNRRHCLHYLTPRLEEAAGRLRRLFHDPSPMAVKARVVQSGVWPFACFGSLNSAPGTHHLHRLRSLATRALIGRHHSMSSYAAMHVVPGVMDPEPCIFDVGTCHRATALRRAFQVQPAVAEQVLALMVEGHFKSLFVLHPLCGRFSSAMGGRGPDLSPEDLLFQVHEGRI